MEIPAWICELKSSVSWGDEILLAQTPENQTYAWIRHGNPGHAWWPGWLNDLDNAIKEAQQLQQESGYTVTLQLLDRKATEAEVEAAIWAATEGGIGISFSAPQPQVHLNGLLLRYSEGTLLDRLPS